MDMTWEEVRSSKRKPGRPPGSKKKKVKLVLDSSQAKSEETTDMSQTTLYSDSDTEYRSGLQKQKQQSATQSEIPHQPTQPTNQHEPTSQMQSQSSSMPHQATANQTYAHTAHHILSNASNTNSIKNSNHSIVMNSISQQKFLNTIFINLSDNANTSRVKLANLWHDANPDSTDVIIKTKNNFILKSNNDIELIRNKLNELMHNNLILNFKIAKNNSSSPQYNSTPPSQQSVSFSLVLANVDREINDDDLSNWLRSQNLIFRYCRRIISRATGKPTFLIRLITNCTVSFQKVLNEGIFYMCRHYPAYPSKPPPPLPVPCAKCNLFTHITANCDTPVKCDKCNGSHSTSKCSSTLPIKCSSCNSSDHPPWSTKCPNHPKVAVSGLPTTKIKNINKRSSELPANLTTSRIHTPITVHDHIIDTYTTEINDNKLTNRDELIRKLQQRFLDLYKIETTAVFSGSRLYVLMFDILENKPSSPTQPNSQATQIIVQNVG